VTVHSAVVGWFKSTACGDAPGAGRGAHWGAHNNGYQPILAVTHRHDLACSGTVSVPRTLLWSYPNSCLQGGGGRESRTPSDHGPPDAGLRAPRCGCRAELNDNRAAHGHGGMDVHGHRQRTGVGTSAGRVDCFRTKGVALGEGCCLAPSPAPSRRHAGSLRTSP